MLAYTIFVQLQSLVVISTHTDRQSVDMSVAITVWLFVNLSLCTVTDFSAGDKVSGVKFCTTVHGRPGHGISHFGEHCYSRSPKSDELMPVLKICSFQKRHRITGRVSGHPGHPLDPPLQWYASWRFCVTSKCYHVTQKDEEEEKVLSFSNLNRARGSYWTCSGQHATRPAYISFRQ